MRLLHTITAVIRPGEQSGYVAECIEIPVVTQGATLDETVANSREAVELHLEDTDLTEIGLAPNPTIIITMELATVPSRVSGDIGCPWLYHGTPTA